MPAMTALPATNDLATFRAALASEGADGALGVLNRGVEHRYTGLYRLDARVMHNMVLIDKAGEVRPDLLASVPFEDSFCQFVLKLGSFHTSDSASDARLNGHRFQGVM